ncbi:Crp/Fnr family transcriptional regulator [Mucilaginibacter segetis]|uniref:Crp/Fnr family transcriptional regulator n=1 Tax=Mucilaginibacter segetis TaxID=2793071 RepID=A0A934UMK4_9SPHI|nr:Crp/Fnr family transcriptional regulator [Mucilaginibacter segetis]MBK0378982.1 Crp/Fnr family transcriptional regulator [Mucilaginibacter segetis]
MSDTHTQLKKFITNQITIEDELLALICNKFRYKATRRNQILLHADEVCPYIYFVNQGCLRVYLLDAAGKEFTRFLITENRFGTAFPSFTLQEPSLAYIESIEPSQLLYISYSDYQSLFDIVPGWERSTRLGLQADYIASIKRIESLITMDAKQRYQLLIKTNPTLVQRLPSKIIADYLGISQETLSRLKSKK